MDMVTLDITREEATERLRQYRKLIAEERTAEDEAIASGLRAAQRGLPVISLTQTMERGGWFADGLPRLAVCRADARQCWVRVDQWRRADRRAVTFSDQEYSRGWARVGLHRVEVDMPPPVVNGRLRWHGRTIVPLIPPEHRPKRARLRNFHILWEVEKWDPIPPKDPALLRHVRGDLWAVMAVWDLTPLERAVLAGRADG